MAHDVFISFSTKDKAIADAACAILEAQRIRCWVAPRDVQPGIPYPQSIMEGIRGSRVLVLILSTKSNTSKHVMREVERAVNCEIPVVPVRIEDVSLSGSMEYLVGSLHWLDALTPPLERHLETLARRILALLAESGRGEASARPPLGKDVPTKGDLDSAPAAPKAHSPPSTSEPGTYSKTKAQGADGLKTEARAMPAEVIEAARPPSPAPAPPIQRQPAVSTQLHGAAPAPKVPRTQPGREWTNSIGMRLVRIEPGSFLMGSSKDQIDQLILMRVFPVFKRSRWLASVFARAIDRLMRVFRGSEWEEFDDEQPQHAVKITHPFYLGTHQVTQRQYQAVMGDNPSHFSGSDLPVENVSWLDAVEFCNKLSERENRTRFYRVDGSEVTVVGGNGYRLPTEAEWEYACRAKSTTLYHSGDDAGKLGEHAWFFDSPGNNTHPVGQKLPNAWGLYDMLGNVGEWCADVYDGEYYASSPPADPPGALRDSKYRVIRGGHYLGDRYDCRPAGRSLGKGEERSKYRGFRVAAVEE